MRLLPALALVVAACDASDRPDVSAAPGSPTVVAPQTRDQLLLRVPRRTGPARVFAYPKLDSLIWTAPEATPVVSRALAFDQDAGTFAFVDTRNVARFLDLRAGSAPPGVQPLKGITSRDAYNVYGVATDGSVLRVTPPDRPGAQGGTAWKFKPPGRATAVYPQPDASIIIVGDRGKSLGVWHLFPPDRQIVDSGSLPAARQAVPIQVGDRLYLATDSGLVGLRGRDLERVKTLRFEQPVIAMAPTPSGDRVYAVTDSSSALYVVDRYRDEIVAEIDLPGQPSALRMDPLGRYLLARPTKGDSAWLVAVGTDRLKGTVKTAWRTDLPVVTPDGGIALLNGKSVVIVDGETLRPRTTIAAGGDDFWHFFEWSGFRPRAAGIDQPVTFDGISGIDSTPVIDTTWADSLFKLPPVIPPLLPGGDTAAPSPPPPIPPDSVRRLTGFTVSFAAYIDQRRARELAESIRIDGRAAHIVPTIRDGMTLYRVVLGPYSTRADADRAGRVSAHPYWVYEGPP